MEKAGLRQVERFTDYDEKTGEPTESYRYQILRSEWEASKRHCKGEISPATPADITVMTESFPDWGARQKHAARWQQQEQSNALYLVARQLGEPVGHAYLKWQGAGDPHVVERQTVPCPDLEDLFVLGAWRSQGIGTALLHMAEELALAWGFQHIGLSVAVENSAAWRLYERLGYQDAGFGEYTEQGTYLNAQGQLQTWEERCVYLIKELA